jgi:pimeloyl-ACP methyl ester carboxylesterase
MNRVPHKQDTVIKLSDGRWLGYAEYGDPKGWPLMFFHGTPGSRVMARFAAPKAWELGVRLIAPERPGFGLSDLQPRRRLIDWPDDIQQLADALRLERFAVIGVSGGGPYVAVCAWKMADRLVGAGIISGLAPVDQVRGELSRGQRLTARLARQSRLANLVLRLLAWSAERHPEMVISGMGLAASREDRKILAQPEVKRTQIDGFIEAFRGGAEGTVLELELFCHPWGFAIEEITMPVNLWHGEEDAIVPVPMGQYLAEHLPHCQARFIHKAGHLWIFEGYEEVFRVLKEKTKDTMK